MSDSLTCSFTLALGKRVKDCVLPFTVGWMGDLRCRENPEDERHICKKKKQKRERERKKDTSADLGLDVRREPGSSDFFFFSDFYLILSIPSSGHQMILPPRDEEGVHQPPHYENERSVLT